MDFRPVKTDRSAIEQQRNLFARCFPNPTQYSAAYLHWLYLENPSGSVVGFEAFDGDRLVAHYVCIPAPIILDGNERRAILSLNTATDPDYQGRGLFTQLASATYAKAAGKNFHAVFGVANANSTPGFIKKLGFQHVGSLLALVGVGSIFADQHDKIRRSATFRRSLPKSMLEWRVANPVNPVGTCRLRTGGVGYAARTHVPSLVSWTERADGINTSQSAPPHLARVFVGCLPTGITPHNFYVPIPQRFRPSPLNLIYRPLGSVPDKIDPQGAYFDFLDFDPF